MITQPKLSPEDVEAGKEIISKLETLKSSMASNAVLEPMPQDGGSDINGYNEELKFLGDITWLASPWLFSECYVYRLVHTFFSMSTPFWRSYDIFFSGKRDSLVASHVGIIELVKRFQDLLRSAGDIDTAKKETQKVIFEEMLQISLWGNATDLTLLTSLSSVSELQSRQGKAAREASKANIVVNNTDKVWSLLLQLKSSGSTGTIHIVLDNAGFELLTDLIFASYLIESRFATKIVLHGKHMPWFVSDVNLRDLESLIDSFINGTLYQRFDSAEKIQLREAGLHWQDLMTSGKMEFRAHPFWTTQHSFGRMAHVEPEVLADLATADLVVFKGDLNYRKLVYDGQWPKTTPFSEALGPLAKPDSKSGKGIRTLALRTCKADVCVGLSAGVEDELESGWTRYGHYAVVSYWDAKA